ncbi:hypothetical protein V6N13_120535 [Hibiscus sabdariffa]
MRSFPFFLYAYEHLNEFGGYISQNKNPVFNRDSTLVNRLNAEQISWGMLLSRSLSASSLAKNNDLTGWLGLSDAEAKQSSIFLADTEGIKHRKSAADSDQGYGHMMTG